MLSPVHRRRSHAKFPQIDEFGAGVVPLLKESEPSGLKLEAGAGVILLPAPHPRLWARMNRGITGLTILGYYRRFSTAYKVIFNRTSRDSLNRVFL